MGNRIASLIHTGKTAADQEYAVFNKEVPGLTRKFDDGGVNTSILEYRHNFAIINEMKGNTDRFFAQAKDENGSGVEGLRSACQFTIPR